MTRAERSARDEKIALAYRLGGTIEKLAVDFGTSETSVWRALKRQNVKRRLNGRPRRDLGMSDERIARLCKKNGYAVMARRLKIPIETLWCRANPRPKLNMEPNWPDDETLLAMIKRDMMETEACR